MKKVWILLTCALFVNLLSAQEPQFTLISSNNQEIVLKVSYPNYQGEVFNTNSIKGERLIMQGAYPILNEGAPELLETAVSIIIPENSNPTVEVLSSKSYIEDHVNLLPSKGRLLRNVDPATVPYVYGKAYSLDKMLYDDTVVVGKPYQLRDFQGVSLQFFPFAYNPAQRELKVYKEMTVRVKFNATGSVRQVNKVASVYNQLYQDHSININNKIQTTIPTINIILKLLEVKNL